MRSEQRIDAARVLTASRLRAGTFSLDVLADDTEAVALGGLDYASLHAHPDLIVALASLLKAAQNIRRALKK